MTTESTNINTNFNNLNNLYTNRESESTLISNRDKKDFIINNFANRTINNPSQFIRHKLQFEKQLQLEAVQFLKNNTPSCLTEEEIQSLSESFTNDPSQPKKNI